MNILELFEPILGIELSGIVLLIACIITFILDIIIPIGIWLIHKKIEAHTIAVKEQTITLELLLKEKKLENSALMVIFDSLKSENHS